MEIKCLSVRNPISYFICCGSKDVENRSRRTSHRGRVYIHSSGQYDYYMPQERHFPESVWNYSQKSDIWKKLNNLHDLSLLFYDKSEFNPDTVKEIQKESIPYHASRSIIGHVDIVDCVQNYKSPWSIDGKWHWILENAVLFEKPIRNIVGKLNFFTVNI